MIWTDNGYGTRRGFHIQIPPLSLASAPFGIEIATPSPLSRLLPPAGILCYSFSEERKVERFSEHLLSQTYVSLQILGLYTKGITHSCSILMTRRTGCPTSIFTRKMNSLRLGIIRHQNLFVSDNLPLSSSSETQMASRQQRLPLKIGILSI